MIKRESEDYFTRGDGGLLVRGLRPLTELPQEDPRSSKPNMVARLIESLYGTRDAAQLWARQSRRR